ncbi:unnamed protein product [Lepidochelys kempii]
MLPRIPGLPGAPVAPRRQTLHQPDSPRARDPGLLRSQEQGSPGFQALSSLSAHQEDCQEAMQYNFIIHGECRSHLRKFRLHGLFCLVTDNANSVTGFTEDKQSIFRCLSESLLNSIGFR